MKKNRVRRIAERVIGTVLIFCLLPVFLPAVSAAEGRSSELLKSMTAEEKVCQLLMPAFRYQTNASGERQNLTALPDELAAMLERHGFAGVIFFAQNAAETEAAARLADAMQTANAKGAHRPQLLTAIDQEGGIVTRLGQGTAFSGNMALGAAGDPAAAAAAAGIIGEELKAIGLNFNFAPVVDVNNNPANPVIGTRSFSDDPRIAAELGVSFMNALTQSGVIATLKHFPGHGDTATDSHTGLPRISKTYEELKANELIPFQACIDAGAEAIMTAHIQYPEIEKGTYISKASGDPIALPATLSKTILTDILRGDMGFDGVIVSDSMVMDAIAKNFDPMDTARLAIAAGVDILLMPVSDGLPADGEGIRVLEKYIADLTALVENGVIPMDQVDAAVLRVLALKEKHGLLDAYDGSRLDARVSNAAGAVGSRAHHEEEWEIAKKAVTLVKNTNGLLPISGSGHKIAVLTAYDNEVRSMEYAVARLRDEQKLPADTAVSVTSIQKKSLNDCLSLIKGADHVIAVSEVGSLSAMDPGSERGAYSALLDALIEQVHKSGGSFTLLSASLPYDAARYPKADAVVITWNARGMSEDPRVTDGPVRQYGASLPAALYQMLCPDAVFSGKLPVSIPALDEQYHYAGSVLYPRGTGLRGGDIIPGDVRPADWYYNAAGYVIGSKIIETRADGRFDPNGGVSRADAARYIQTASGVPVLLDDSGAQDAVTREAFAAMLFSAAKEQGKDVSVGEDTNILSYDDAFDISSSAMPAMQWACGAGIINGTASGRLSPLAAITRAQAAVMLLRFAGL